MQTKITRCIFIILSIVICLLNCGTISYASQNDDEIIQDGFIIEYWNRSYSAYKDYNVSYKSDFSYCLVSENPNHLRITKTFKVEKNKQYAIFAYFKTEDIVNENNGAGGANIATQNWEMSSVTLSGDNDWTEIGLLTNSGDNTEIVVSFGLGYYGNLATGKVYIDGIECIEAEIDIANTNVSGISNWANVSPVQQFQYMNNGFAYAYKDDELLKIVTPEKNINIAMEYPLLGDVTSDDNGNFYVVWGRENQTSDYNVETVFISKYSKNGEHIKTTGFVGKCSLGNGGNTNFPFDVGNCSSALHDGVLMVNYGRSMYVRHQSNNVIGVHIDDMSPVNFYSIWDIPYTSHSFNQRVIWSEHANDFIYADHGDAYSRGFVISADGSQKRIFTFYLQSNAGYNMGVVNKTFAQLGGLVETSKGVVLVGASAKSISSNAETEKQNLFVQIFNPNATKISESMFVGGEERSGATSFDINDNQNSPLSPVTDYGVQWITNHIDKDVIAPHSVVVNDHIVILWNEKTNNVTEAFYTILKSNGDILKPSTSLGKNVQLNSNEDPICCDGKVYWASAYNRKINVKSINVADEISKAKDPLHIISAPTNQNGEVITADNISNLNKLKVNIENVSADNMDSLCLAGFYDEKGKLQLLSSKTTKLPVGIKMVEIDIDAGNELSTVDTIKLFIWDAEYKFNPLSSAKTFRVSD